MPKRSKKEGHALYDNPIESVDIDPFADIIGTRMEVQLSGIIADLLLKTHSILPYASNEVIERHLTFLEAYFDPYLKPEERERIQELDEGIKKRLDSVHPLEKKKIASRLYNDYIEKKLKVLMNCAYSQDMIPGRIKTMRDL